MTKTPKKNGLNKIIEEEIKRKLEEEGYRDFSLIGEGWTRKTYLCKYEVELPGEDCIPIKFTRERVIKIPKSIDKNIESATTIMNLAKGDPTRNEISVSNEIAHENLAQIIDILNIEVGNKNIPVIVEEYVNGVSLEEHVKRFGRLSDESKIYDLFSQILDGLEYLIDKKRILHRDLKPSNIIVGKEGVVKITDLQNAKKIDEIQEKYCPTRGATKYTHPEIINCLLKRKPTKTSVKTEIYAMGATLYYVLAGEPLLDISLKTSKNPKNRIILENGGEIFVELVNEKGEPLEGISRKKYEAYLKSKLKKVPKKFRKLLKNSLGYDVKYNSVKEFRRDFEKVFSEGGFMKKISKKVAKNWKNILIASGVLLTSMGVYNLSTISPKKIPLDEFLNNENNKYGSYYNFLEVQNKSIPTWRENPLGFYIPNAKGVIDRLNENDRRIIESICNNYEGGEEYLIKSILMMVATNNYEIIKKDRNLQAFIIKNSHKNPDAISKKELLESLAEYINDLYVWNDSSSQKTIAHFYISDVKEAFRLIPNPQGVNSYEDIIKNLDHKTKDKIYTTIALKNILEREGGYKREIQKGD